jgi:dTMP kinase
MRTPERPGLLLAMEGIDGAGKTTQVRALASLLAAAGVPFVTTKEPTGGPWGRKIRESARSGRLSLADELDAFLRDRREHVAEVLEPALAAGKVVLVDRYYFSTVAYQGARGLDPAELLARNAFAPAPDILVVLDVAPALGLARVRARGDVADQFEREDQLTRAREIFRGLELPYLLLVDGAQDAARVTEVIAGRLFAALGRAAPVLPAAT